VDAGDPDAGNGDADAGTDPATWAGLTSYIGFEDHDGSGLYDHAGRLFFSNITFDDEGVRGESGVLGEGVAYYAIPDSMDLEDPYNFNENLFSIAFWFKSTDKSLDLATQAGTEVELFTRTGYTMAWGLERTDDDANMKTWLRFQSRASEAIFDDYYQDLYPDFCYFNSDGDRNFYCPNDNGRALQDVEYRQDPLADSEYTNRDLRDGAWHHVVLTHKPFQVDMDDDGESDVLPLSADETSINPDLIAANNSDGRYYRLYVDGVLVDEESSRLKDFDNNGDSDTEDTTSLSSKLFVIGGGICETDCAVTVNSKEFDRLFNGEVDEVYVFDRDLTAAEVQQLYLWR